LKITQCKAYKTLKIEKKRVKKSLSKLQKPSKFEKAIHDTCTLTKVKYD
jgi:hypothetical protein